MSKRRSLALGLGLSLLAPLVAPGGASALAPVDPTVTRAFDWLLSEQQANGGFEQTNFAGFETPDAILALSEATQAGPTWSPAFARTGIEAIESSDNKNPLNYVDDLVDTGDTTNVTAAVQAAKVITLVAAPLGIDAADFDPSNDSAAAVDLPARIRAYVQPNGTVAFGSFFNGVLYTAIGFRTAGIAEPTGIGGQIRAAQRPDGSWNYAGDQDPATSGDIDTTSTALLALTELGAARTDPAVRSGIEFLASTQAGSGAWQSFGSDDPNSTAVASIALSKLHIDVSTGAWRARYGAPLAPGQAYVSPYAFLRSQQAADGHIASANDAYPPVNTFATSQSVQALARQWFLSPDRANLVTALATQLGSPKATPGTAAATVTSDALGTNASILTARRGAADAVLSSLFGRQAAAADLFQRAFHRAIDPSGLDYWSRKLQTITRSQMLERLTGSSEFYRRAGSTTAGFVDSVYQAVLGRPADPNGRDYWIRKIDGGDSPLHVAQSLVASTEFRRKTVDAAYQDVLQRPADPSGRAYWTNKLATTRVEVLLASLAATESYYDRVTGPAPG